MTALAAAQGANAAALGAKSTGLANDAMGSTMNAWNQRQPLRDQGIKGMQAAPVALPQMGVVAGGGNPFAASRIK